MRQTAIRAASAVVDVIGVLMTPAVASISRIQAKLGPERLARTYRIWDAFGVMPMPFHYFQPAIKPSDLPPDLDRRRSAMLGVDMHDEAQLDLLRSFRFEDELLEFPIAAPRPGKREFFYDNEAFCSGDAEILYSMIRHFKPRTVLEVGCGSSTLLIEAAKRKNAAEGNNLRHVCIEPFEVPWLEQAGVDQVIRQKIEDVGPELIDALEPNDILFVDSSHVVRAQGDVCHEILTLLPRLKPGVIAHFHDIFLPFDYPHEWLTRYRRFWTEQYLLHAFLAFNGSFKTLCALNYLAHRYPEELHRACPVFARQPGRIPGSYWLRRVD